MIADEHPDWDALSPETLGGSPVGLSLYVEDADMLVKQAEAAGAKITRPAQNHFTETATAN